MELTAELDSDFVLESGAIIPGIQVQYTLSGPLNSGKPLVWVCHALTADANVQDWWKDVVGDDGLFHPENSVVICANNLGSCYGTTGPESQDAEEKGCYQLDFPEFTIRDMAKVHQLLAEHLGIKKIDVLVGASMGGQIALEWAIQANEKFRQLILIATNAQHSPWGIAFNETQRMALLADPEFGAGGAAHSGLQAARAVALLSYRTYTSYGKTQKGFSEYGIEKAITYQHYQGQKLSERFSAYAYWYLSKAMDSHHVGRNRGGIEKALAKVQANTLVIGIRQDLLFPVEEQQLIAHHIPGASYVEMDSIYGHDGFLTESKTVAERLEHFLQSDYLHNEK